MVRVKTTGGSSGKQVKIAESRWGQRKSLCRTAVRNVFLEPCVPGLHFRPIYHPRCPGDLKIVYALRKLSADGRQVCIRMPESTAGVEAGSIRVHEI